MSASTEREERCWRRLIVWSAVVSAAILLWLRCDYRNGSKFDQQVWQNYCKDQHTCFHQETSCQRGGMVGDIQHRLKPGSTPTEIEALLGPHDYAAPGRASCWEYELGYCSGFGIDIDGLVVCFDSSGKLSDSYTVQH